MDFASMPRPGVNKAETAADADDRLNTGLIAPEGQMGFHRPAPVVGADGKPISRALDATEKQALSKEAAPPELVGYRAYWDQSVARGLTPDRLAAILLETRRGDIRPFIELAEEMEERDLHYFAVLSTRKRQVARLRPAINEKKAKGADKRVIAAVTDLIEAPIFRSLLKHSVDALGKGFAVSEIVWTEGNGLWTPAGYLRRDQKFFTFDHITRTEIRLAETGTIDGVELPWAKFVRHAPEIKSGSPVRGGFAWLAAWAWLFKQYTLKDWVSFLDIFGMPIRVGKYHPSATADDRRKLLQAVSRIAVDAACIIPESMQIEFLESKGFADKPFENMGNYLDKQMSKAILGQTMTTDAQTGGLAQAKVHDEVRIDILEDDAEELAYTINRDLIDVFVSLNFGADAQRPWVDFPVAEPQDIAVKSTAIAQLVSVGLKVAQSDARDLIGLREPEDGEDVLAPPAGGAGDVKASPDTSQAVRLASTAARYRLDGRCACGCEDAAFNAEGVGTKSGGPPPHDAPIVESEELVSQALGDWREITDPLFGQLLALANGATTLEEVLARAQAASLDTGPLIDRLAKATAISRGLGDVKD